MGNVQLRILVLREGDVWIAQCLEHDISAQAPDFSTLRQRMDLTLQVELEESVRRTGKPFGGIDPAPAYIHETWNKEHGDGGFTASGTAPAKPGGPGIDYEMALCA